MKKIVKIHGWIKYIIKNLRLSEFCHDSKVVPYIKYEKISDKTLIKYTEMLVKCVVKNIKPKLRNKVTIMLDGWSEEKTYFMAIYDVHPSSSWLGYNWNLLRFSPLENETDHYAKEHEQLFKYVNDLFGKNLSYIVAIIAGNRARNIIIARNVSISFVWYASHRYNLAVDDIENNNSEIISSVKKIVSMMCFYLRRAQLFEFIEYAPVKWNDTRWSSVNDMLPRYVFIRGHLSKLNIPDLNDLLLGREKAQEIDKRFGTMKKLNSIKLKLQPDDATVSQIRCFFDPVIDFIPKLSSRLNTTFSIVERNGFESALVKIELEKKLNVEEKQLVKNLEVMNKVFSEIEDDQKSLADAVMKRFRENQQSIKSK